MIVTMMKVQQENQHWNMDDDAVNDVALTA